MFTGIVEAVGRVTDLVPDRVRIHADGLLAGMRPGDSIAVDGVCLTVTDLADGEFAADLLPETLRRSTLGERGPGDAVNLERAVTAATRLGGHIVQGHVDGTARILSREPAAGFDAVRVELPAPLARYVVEKGSIAVDGVSLTVVAVTADAFDVGLVPATLAGTGLGGKAPGDRVNLEVDIVAKYVERLVAPTGTPAATSTGEKP